MVNARVRLELRIGKDGMPKEEGGEEEELRLL
jgi:hypothetical protein